MRSLLLLGVFVIAFISLMIALADWANYQTYQHYGYESLFSLK